MSRTLYVIDPNVVGYEKFLESLPEDGIGLVLDPNLDGLTQVAEFVAGYADISAIHIISHGSAGTLLLGNATITLDTLVDYQALLQQIGARLTGTRDILLYGCEIGFGEAGQAFVDRFATLTGADVAASNDRTGAEFLGGDWVLEATRGVIESSVLRVDGYSGSLAAVTGTAGDDVLTNETTSDTIDGGTGNDTVVYAGGYADYTLTPLATGLLVSRGAERDLLTNVERLQFADVTVDVVLKGAAEVRVNTYTRDHQMGSKIARLSDGSWVVIWQSVNQDGSGWGVYGQLYSPDGSVRGGEFRVNAHTDSSQTDWGRPASVVALANGGFAVVFDEWGPNGANGSNWSWNIRGQVFDAQAQMVGPEFYVTTGSNQEFMPSITELSNGELVVSWHAESDGSSYGVFAQRLAADGTAIGAPISVNTNTTSNQSDSQIIALADGSWLVVWRSDHNDRIQGQKYAADGTAVGQEIQLSGDFSSHRPSIVALPDGGFLLAYQAWYPPSDSEWGVVYSRHDASGQRMGEAVQVNTTTSSTQHDPSVAVLEDGGWVIVWSSYWQDGSEQGIYGQRYDAQGARVGGEFQVNTFTTNAQHESSVAGLADGGWVVSWTSIGQDGSETGVYSQRYTADGVGYGDADLSFVGAPTNDHLVGDSADNTFAGGDGDDLLEGFAGNDYLIAGTGTDILRGGDGDDRLVTDS
jgi:Ca2+-binding RTX toxin-like protein